ncbi:MAG: hypothetical protein AB9828_04125 [Sphaerochaetaceae bacterium]
MDTQQQEQQEQGTESQGHPQNEELYRRNPAESQKNQYDGHAVAALILGILSILGPFKGFGLGGFIGVVLGTIGIFQATASLKQGLNPMARTGKVLSIIGVVISGLTVIAICSFLFSGGFGYWHVRPMMMMPSMGFSHGFWF